jgi:hypothetical protein
MKKHFLKMQTINCCDPLRAMVLFVVKTQYIPSWMLIVPQSDKKLGPLQSQRLVCGNCLQCTMNYRLGVGLCEMLWIRKFLFCCTWLALLQEFPHSL